MTKKNLTLQLDESLLKKSRHLALAEDMSLSEWVATLITQTLEKQSGREFSKRRALKILSSPLKLGGKIFSRDELHER